jgi:hypothetical protein
VIHSVQSRDKKCNEHSHCRIRSLPLLLPQNKSDSNNSSSITKKHNDRSFGSDDDSNFQDDDQSTDETATLPFDDSNVTRRRHNRYQSRDSFYSAWEETLRQKNDNQNDLAVSEPFGSVKR